MTNVIYPTVTIWGTEVSPITATKDVYELKPFLKALGLSMTKANSMLRSLPELPFSDSITVPNELMQYIDIKIQGGGSYIRVISLSGICTMVKYLCPEQQLNELLLQIEPYTESIVEDKQRIDEERLAIQAELDELLGDEPF